MGDRANIVFNTTGLQADTPLAQAMQGAIVLYSHWGGSDLGPDAARALRLAAPRWNDFSYATRIMVSQIVGAEWMKETGFGLSVGELCDNERPVLVIDFKHRQVAVYAEGGEAPLRHIDFYAFAAFTPDEARKFHLGK